MLNEDLADAIRIPYYQYPLNGRVRNARPKPYFFSPESFPAPMGMPTVK